MKKIPISIFVIPIVLLIVLALILQFSSKQQKKPDISSENQGNSSISEKTEKVPEPMAPSRMPVYPGSGKIALTEGSVVTEASFYLSTDPIDSIKAWYLETLQKDGNRVNLIDVVNVQGLRTITLSLSDPPNELVELKERTIGSAEIILTITTVEFYTRNQPEPIDLDPETIEKVKADKLKRDLDSKPDDNTKDGQPE